MSSVFSQDPDRISSLPGHSLLLDTWLELPCLLQLIPGMPALMWNRIQSRIGDKRPHFQVDELVLERPWWVCSLGPSNRPQTDPQVFVGWSRSLVCVYVGGWGGNGAHSSPECFMQAMVLFLFMGTATAFMSLDRNLRGMLWLTNTWERTEAGVLEIGENLSLFCSFSL